MNVETEAYSHMQTYPVLGERLPPWIALLLIMVGVMGSLYSTYAYIYSKLLSDCSAIVIAEPRQISITKAAENKVEGGQVAALPQSAVATSANIPVPQAAAQSVPKSESLVSGIVCPPFPLVFFKRDHIAPINEQLTEKVLLLKGWLEQHPQTKIILEGHSDGHGSDELNLIFSLRRANLVKAIMIKTGIAADQLLVKAHGKTELLPNEPQYSDKNRRVTIRADSTQDCINPLFNGVKK
jgi:outer membrane protein OmpA-like peptidoglycan-associated protein